MMKKELKYILLGVLILIFDQVTKHILKSANYDYGWIAIRGTTNTGISFGLFQGSTVIVSIISVILIGALVYYKKEFEGKEIFLTLILAGIIGNLIDRVFLGHVIDFIDLKWWPVFNVADSSLFIGVFGTIILVIIEQIQKSSKASMASK